METTWLFHLAFLPKATSITLSRQSVTWGSQGRKLKEDAETETIEESSLLAYSLFLALGALLCSLGPHAYGWHDIK